MTGGPQPQPPRNSTAEDRCAAERAFEEARSHHRAGRIAEAELLYQQTLDADPRHAGALHCYGILALHSGHPAMAADLIGKAVAVDASDAGYHLDFGAALSAQGKLEEAIASYERALELNPNMPEVLCNLANAVLRLGRAGEAIARYEQALAIAPDVPQALANLGNILWQQGRLDEAIARCRQALSIQPDFPDALVTLGNALREKGELDQAVVSYRRAVLLKPDFAEAFSNLGNAFRQQGKLREALACYRHALAINPEFPEALSNLGDALQEEGKLADAMACCRRALMLDPSCADAHYNLGSILLDIGRLEEGRQHYEAAVVLRPRNAHYYFSLVNSAPVQPGDPHLAAMETLARDIDSLVPKDQIALHFALGKAYADLGERERSFRRLLEGNRLKRQQQGYDETAELAAFSRLEAVFNRALIERNRNVGDSSSLPIFVIGMPRSGTTLVEQILAAHPLVFGAGELTELAKILACVPPPPSGPQQMPELVATLPGDQIRQIGTAYAENLRTRAPWAERITDKLPENYLYAGLIHIALPNARILHIRRDPVDTCLSCFSQLFSEGHAYSYDLAELGRRYKAYARLMDHWRSVLPPGAMLEIRYEELVGDFEAQARRIIDYCGLPWDPACLAFHKIDRPVRTASASQVRRPIYGSAVGRSAPYREMLQPLIGALR
jgi:tetratricopeptide (TPR) repeat protein